MAEAAPSFDKHNHLPPNERVLTEVDNLLRYQNADGSYTEGVLEDVLQNLKTRVQEGAMPYAISETEHVYDQQERTFIWLGKAALQNAMSGYRFHVAPAARARVDVEVDEALHAEEDLRPGILKVFISPKMTRADADLATAKSEHLADDDAVRASWLVTNPDGTIQKRVLHSLLIKDVPLQAWTDMLLDPNNIFGKSIQLQDTKSALSVMKVHRELELPLGSLKNGLIDVIRSVATYIDDPVVRQKVDKHIELFNGDQRKLDELAEEKAQAWLQFEANLAQSLQDGWATYEIDRFITGLQHEWSSQDLKIIQNHTVEGKIMMTRKLAVVLEEAKENTIWTKAAVLSGNEAVLDQMSPSSVAQILHNESRIQSGVVSAAETHALEAQNNRLIAQANVEVGGGCTGGSSNKFNKDGQLIVQEREEGDDPDDWEWTPGVCRVESCVTRPGTTEVGPCSVCKTCQFAFDHGIDPTKNKPRQEAGPEETDWMDDVYVYLRKTTEEKSDQTDVPRDTIGVFAGIF